MIVVDASVLVDVVLRGPGYDSIKRRLSSDSSWHAPHHIDLEVAHALHRQEGRGGITADRAAAALDMLGKFPLTRWPPQPFLPRVWKLRTNLRSYDAAYVALAEALDVPLVTRDRGMKAAPGHRAKVELIA